MDVNALLGGIFPTVTANATAAAGNASASQVNVVENILPLIGLKGFAPMYRFIGSWLGWDPTYLLTVLGFIWASNKVVRQIFYFLYGLVTEYLMSTIHISSTDDIYLHLMAWLSKQPRMVNSRALMAETTSKTAWEDEDESTVARDHSGLYLNFSNQEARTVSSASNVTQPSLLRLRVLTIYPLGKTPQYIPAVGLHNFWWKGQYFRLHRKKESVFEDGSNGGLATFKDKEDLMISCLWRSPGEYDISLLA
jgi:chaperone BCS1